MDMDVPFQFHTGHEYASVAELRMGAMTAGWGSHRRFLLERFIHGFELRPLRRPRTSRIRSAVHEHRQSGAGRPDRKFEAIEDKAARQAAIDAAEKDGTRVKPEFGSEWMDINGPDQEHANVHRTIAVPGATRLNDSDCRMDRLKVTPGS